MSTGEIVADFITAMDRAGMSPAEPIAHLLEGGGLIRFQCGDDRKGRRNGWAVLHLDGRPAGAFGSYKMGFSSTWRAEGGGHVCGADRVAFALKARLAAERRAKERREQHALVAAKCEKRWEAAGSADPSHPYLVRKNVSGEGLRQAGSTLLVPMLDDGGRVWNLQSIYPDGAKFFAKGGRQEGLHFIIGSINETVVIGEGYSTLATVRRATGHPVVIAFAASNLAAVAMSIRERFPSAEIVLAADDDAHLLANPKIQKNLGVEAAKKAARAVGGRIAMPPRRN